MIEKSFIEFFPASNGDSMLIKLNDYFMLVDGGYVNTYDKFIKPKLKEINCQDKILNHVIVSHIDKDHISGIIKLIKENRKSLFISIENIWHNSFRHIKDFNADFNFKGKSISSFKTGYRHSNEDDISSQDVSAIQGSTLASELYKTDIKWNSEFNGEAVSVENNSLLQLEEGVTLKLLSPSKKKLKELNMDWKRELYKGGYATDEDIGNFSEDVFETILANQKEKKVSKLKNVSSAEISITDLATSVFHEDTASANGSSIAFILENQNVKLLLLGDAHPSQVIQGLKLHFKEDNFPILFDVIKVSHHGSQKNTSNELLDMVSARKYVFLTNGKSHHHPDKETIARIISKTTEHTKELYFNYPLESIKDFKREELTKEYNYKIIENSKDKSLIINLKND